MIISGLKLSMKKNKILILGHNGMLGNAVSQYYEKNIEAFQILKMKARWGDEAFKEEVIALAPDYIINCIGAIPQKNPSAEQYQFLNIDLPIFIEGLGVPTIHPSTDCEFSGKLEPGQFYTKKSTRDAEDVYSKSKASISEKIENEFTNTKIIRVSIIGHENISKLSLLEWFLSQEGETRGYTNHYWNGITTLQWAKISKGLIENWDNSPVLNQFGTEKNASKYDLLNIIKSIYQKDIKIIPFETALTVNKCMESDEVLPDIEIQLKELKEFYTK